MDLVIATHNTHKFKEIEAILGKLPLKLISLAAYPDVPALEEKGNSYTENAFHKARPVAEFTGQWVLADDTGLEVDALGGAPGLYSARYAGEGVSFRENRDKLLKALKGIPWEKRSARFRCVIVLVGPGAETVQVDGIVSGYITEEERGEGGFGYDAIFFVPEWGKTFSELKPDEKNQVSHRAQALKKVRPYLMDRLNVK